MWYVYILLCRDDSLYTGITNNLTNRLKEHAAGKGGAYTRSHPPRRMLYSETVATKSDALKREHQIKSWTRQKKISTLELPL